MKTNLVDVKEINLQLADLDAVGRIRWVWENFGAGLMASTSFGLRAR